ncbi:23S rRNA (uracil(1939)-C(5))-methyltransferase RlmD [Simiduia agarivorans]|uniref:23S rRNA m(5)U1939 methyltransferase n=1 Tax=Simiduia agarivorans (strain DSM 21679 / JCM 13881 / BCRC 17597 / SA1) TaxID=1117647 RepID=K4KFZ0_SIMAS|nr:23S rRNA (uracil(1939)-C(5))-methyltransferase RlmD [Simiduia agarivorans]AFU97871.1 23S rRNA m(5)U1939 methyltransferase [Simiduia agarivorans SA1 = DSM 21679]
MTRAPVSRRRKPAQKGTGFSLSSPVTIERLGHDGRGIGYCDGKITFVAGALPAETHRVWVTETKRNYQAGKSHSLESEPSSDRVTPECAHYGVCGGCQLQHMSQAAQVNYKESLLTDQLVRAGVDLACTHIEPLVADGEWGYRRRARLAVNHKGPVFAGFRTMAGSDLVRINHCPVLSPVLDRVLNSLQGLMARMRSKTIGHVELTDHSGGPSCLIRLTARPNADEREAFLAFTEAKLYFQWPGSRDIQDIDEQAADQAETLTIDSYGKSLTFSLDDFIQVNATINHHLIANAMALAEPQKHESWLDLFCGMGNFTFALAPYVKRVWGVEAIPEMIEKSRANAVRLGVANTEFLVADLQDEQQLKKLPDRIDGVLLDPPRAGAKEALVRVVALNPARIVYVSCDPATFARDATYLIQQGYRLARLQPHDMFPQTMHLETLALFVRR